MPRSNSACSRYQRISVDAHWVESLPFNQRCINDLDPSRFPKNEFPYKLSIQVDSIFHVAAGHYLNDDLSESAVWAKRLIEVALKYFFGDWRLTMPNNPYHPEEDDYWAQGGGSWISAYHTALAFAVALRDWEGATRLSAHPSEDKKDASPWQQEKPWYLLLAEYFSCGMSSLYEPHLAAIRAGSAKGPKVFAACLDAIVKNRTDEIDARFAEQMKYYLRTQKKRDEMEFKLALDGTILYHLARRQGYELLMDEFTRDHLIIFDQ